MDIATHLATYERDGFVVLPRAASAEVLSSIRGELESYLGDGAPLGRNDFEGRRTNRVYALLAKAPSVAALVEHPWVLAMLDRLLLPNYLLSANLAVNLRPGESVHQLHHDDGFYPLARPRRALSVSTVWAIDDFTRDNGATEVIPGSHLWGDELPSADDPRLLALEMPAGSVVVFAGTLWHRAGANGTSRARLGMTIQYCEPWLRQQEQQIVSVGSAAASFSDRIRTMIGYSMHPPFMGMIDGLHPLRRLAVPFDASATGAGRVAAETLKSVLPERTPAT